MKWTTINEIKPVKKVWKMSNLEEHHQSVGLVAGDSVGGSRWEDRQQVQHPSSMNNFLVEMTNCQEDYFNTQEVPTLNKYIFTYGIIRYFHHYHARVVWFSL